MTHPNDECHQDKSASQDIHLAAEPLRYTYFSGGPKKIQANVGIPKFLSLNDHVLDEVRRPLKWNNSTLCIRTVPNVRKPGPQERLAVHSSPPVVVSSCPAADDPGQSLPFVLSRSPSAAGESRRAFTSPRLTELHVCSGSKPHRSSVKGHEFQERAVNSLHVGQQVSPAAEDEHPPAPLAKGDQSISSATGDNVYHLVSIISHYCGEIHSGQYISDVYSFDRDRWL